MNWHAVNWRKLLDLGAWVGSGLLLLVLIAGVVVSSRWFSYTTATGHFRVQLPGITVPVRQQVPTQMGTLTMHAYTLVNYLHRSTYVAASCEYPLKLTEEIPAETLLDGARDQAVNHWAGKVRTERDISLPHAIGRDITFQASGLGTVRLRVLLADRRMYTLLVFPVPDGAGSGRVERFFNSFSILD